MTTTHPRLPMTNKGSHRRRLPADGIHRLSILVWIVASLQARNVSHAFAPTHFGIHSRQRSVHSRLATTGRSRLLVANIDSDIGIQTPHVKGPSTSVETSIPGDTSGLDEKVRFGCLVEESLQTAQASSSYNDYEGGETDGPDIAPRSTSPVPRLNNAPVFGLRPQSPCQYLIAATGSRPMRFSIQAGTLPKGLQLDAANGIITGQTTETGSFSVQLMATNSFGVSTKTLTIQVGDTIALTPPRGISTWNSCGDTISESKVRSIANAAVRLGLRDYGYTYINIDDGWQGSRNEEGFLQPNEKFHDMKVLFDDLHALGFHCGIYGTPWKWSYAHYPGGSSDPQSWLQDKPPLFIPNIMGWRIGKDKYEEQDAAYFNSIGADFVKWDWYRNDVPSTRRMAEAMRRQPRDMVYSLSNSAPIENAKDYQELANMVRTTADIRDAWDTSSPRDSFCLSIKEIWRQHNKWAPYCKPGHWTDSDMLVVGPVGWGACRLDSGTGCKRNEPFNHLTADEQLTHMTLWILWAAPLLIGCDLDRIEDRTLDMLCNPGALGINEDPLGRQGQEVSRCGDSVVVAKPLYNGDVAVGLFNTGPGERHVQVTWEELGLDSASVTSVHDVWADHDLTVTTDGLGWSVREHSAKLFRISTTLE